MILIAAPSRADWGDLLKKAKDASEIVDKVSSSAGKARPAAPEQSSPAKAAPRRSRSSGSSHGSASGEESRYIHEGPCCSVLSIDAPRRSVTALVRSTGRMFRFSVQDAKALKKVRACDTFEADLSGLEKGKDFTADFIDAGQLSGELATNIGGAGRVLGIKPHLEHEGTDLILTELKRTPGNLLTASWLYCNSGPTKIEISKDLVARRTEAKLLDLDEKLEYGVEHPEGRDWLYSDHHQHTSVYIDRTLKTWVKFASPEGDLVSLIVPGATEPFEGISLTQTPESAAQETPAPAASSDESAKEPPADQDDRNDDATKRLGESSPADDNDDGESDPEMNVRQVRPGLTSSGKGGSGQTVHLSQHPKRQEIVDGILKGLKNKEIDVSILGGHKYMVNSCLGIKASAGEFNLKIADPKLKFEGTKAVLSFGIDHVSIDALKIRMRPNASNPLKPCKFSKKFKVGGSAKDIKIETRFDPLLNLKQCKVGSLAGVHTKFRIGNLNLKPLQNNLDEIAKNMIEDSVTYAVDFNTVNQMIRIIDDILEADCPGKAAGGR